MRMKGTDIISCLHSKYIMRRKPYIISHKRYIIFIGSSQNRWHSPFVFAQAFRWVFFS